MAWDSPIFPHHRPASKDTVDIQATSNSSMHFMVAKATTSTAAWELIKPQLVKVIKVAHTASTQALAEAITEATTSVVAAVGAETMDINGTY